MNSIPLNDIDIYRHAKNIVKDLEAMPVGDALTVLNKAVATVLTENRYGSPDLAKPVYPFNPNLVRRRKLSKIDNDPELKAFIYRLPMYQTLDQIIAACVKEFGKERAPSRTSLHRFLQRISKPNQVASKEGGSHD